VDEQQEWPTERFTKGTLDTKEVLDYSALNCGPLSHHGNLCATFFIFAPNRLARPK
jgi:hypothetical protein